MIHTRIPCIGFAAYSGTGKTTLLTKLIALFAESNIRTGVIKHAHHSFEIDYPGKDSYRLRMAGASQVLIGSSKRWALISEVSEDDSLGFYLKNLHQDMLDLILVEGFKPEAIPKIEIHRTVLGHPLLSTDDDSIIAIATDNKAAIHSKLPVFDLDEPGEIVEFIIERFIKNSVPAPTA